MHPMTCGRRRKGRLVAHAHCRERLRHAPDAFDDTLVEPAAAYDEAVVGRVEPCVQLREVVAANIVVAPLLGAHAVRVLCAEERPREGLAHDGVDLAAFDGELLAALGAVCRDLLFGKYGVQDDLLGHFGRLRKELAQRAERYVYIVAVDVHVEPRAVIVEPLGYLDRVERDRALAQKIGRGRCRKGFFLHRDSGMKDECHPYHLELVAGEHI